MKTYSASSLTDRARAYLAEIPGAISGSGGHDQTFAAACALVRFGLSPSDAWPLLLEYNRRCSPPWSERELEHKLRDAYRVSRSSSIPERFTPAPSKQRIDPVSCVENFLRGFRAGEPELLEASLFRPPDDWTKDGIFLLEYLHAPGELINFVTEFKLDSKADGSQKAVPRGIGETIERDQLLERWRVSGTPASDAGGWLRMNPVDGNGISNTNVTAHRFALLECDAIPLELQFSLFAKLPLPIAAILGSGGRSLHAWVKVDCGDANEYKRIVACMLGLLGRFGVDGKNKNTSRLSRLPGVVRKIGADGDGRQRVFYLNPNPQRKAIL